MPTLSTYVIGHFRPGQVFCSAAHQDPHPLLLIVPLERGNTVDLWTGQVFWFPEQEPVYPVFGHFSYDEAKESRELGTFPTPPFWETAQERDSSPHAAHRRLQDILGTGTTGTSAWQAMETAGTTAWQAVENIGLGVGNTAAVDRAMLANNA